MADSYDPRTVSELLALLAHDLRNPLSALHSNLGFVVSSIDPEQRDLHDALRDALISCEGLAHLIDNLEVFGRGLTSGPVPVRPTVLGPLLTEQLGKCRSMADSHGVALMLVAPPPSGLRVLAGADALGACLANLMRNAIQHATGREPVRISVYVEPASCRVLIEDDGAPLPGAVREAVFTAAGQLQAKTTPGLRYARGLGLLCARLSADAAGAKLEVHERAAGSGAAFSVTVPVA